jgi:hypothetical protein
MNSLGKIYLLCSCLSDRNLFKLDPFLYVLPHFIIFVDLLVSEHRLLNALLFFIVLLSHLFNNFMLILSLSLLLKR